MTSRHFAIPVLWSISFSTDSKLFIWITQMMIIHTQASSSELTAWSNAAQSLSPSGARVYIAISVYSTCKGSCTFLWISFNMIGYFMTRLRGASKGYDGNSHQHMYTLCQPHQGMTTGLVFLRTQNLNIAETRNKQIAHPRQSQAVYYTHSIRIFPNSHKTYKHCK